MQEQGKVEKGGLGMDQAWEGYGGVSGIGLYNILTSFLVLKALYRTS